MKTVTLDGIEYGLALGPRILARLRGLATDLFPMGVQKVANKYAVDKGVELTDLGDSDWGQMLAQNLISDDQLEIVANNQVMYESNVMEKTLRSVNGKRMTTAEIGDYLDEEMDDGHFHQLNEIINDAVVAFKSTVEDEEGKSELSSNQAAERATS